MGIIRLAKYHIVLFMVFSLLVLLSFFISEGGDLNTPGILTAYYLISATLSYLPLLSVLTVLNFIILSVGFAVFSDYTSRSLVCLLPVLIFGTWFILLGNDDAFRYYSLSNLQFSVIFGIWSFLVIIGMIAYSRLRKYLLPVAILPAFLFTLWFLLQKYNLTPPRLSLTDFQFKTILAIWTFLNYNILMRFCMKRLTIKSIEDGENKNIDRSIRK